ncbi:MAG TPA: phenylalanine--tRNA ligase subunit beta [Thermoleophilaceae bacterium]
MRIPVAWLRSYCDPGAGAAEIADALTMAGIKLERLHRTGVGDPAEFVVGRVLDASKHPDADRLTVCTVDDGSGAARTIVCGAPNVASGQTVAVALPGAVMPDGSKLGEAKLRGVRSSGMILAEDEVGIGEDHAGIMVLDGDLPPGAALAEHLPIADEAIEIEITPNRPDAMSVYGVARDLHAVTAAPLAADPAATEAEAAGGDSAEDHASVEIADPEICLRFTARVFEDVRIGPSPLWLKQRLMAAGQRPISNVVDITNYVMLTCGQPMHAFDLDRVRGSRIVVRRAREGETMTTLDGVERRFGREVALVCDAEGPSGIAGVMGGQISEVSEKTTRVLMEAATWVGPNIMRTSKELGLRTEASARFEKQLHPELALAGQRLAAQLMVELCGARMVPGTIDAYPRPAEPRRLTLRVERLEKLLGERVPEDEVVAILERLGFAPGGGSGSAAGAPPAGGSGSPDGGGSPAGSPAGGSATVSVTVPPWRDSDVQREIDLVEEVARIHGLDKLPTTLPGRESTAGRLTPKQRLRRRVEDALRDRGLHESVSYSFTSPATLARLRLGTGGVLAIENPLSEGLGVMRPVLLPGLLEAVRHNAAHGQGGVALFESAHVYRAAGPLTAPPDGSPRGALPADETHHIAALMTLAAPATWRSPAREADYYAARALLDALMSAAAVAWLPQTGEGENGGGSDPPPGGGGAAQSQAQSGTAAGSDPHPFLHPGRSARVHARGRDIGWVGEVHPSVLREWDLEAPVAGFEVDFDALAELAPGPAFYSDVTTFPAVRQDIAVVLPDDVPAARAEAAVRAGGGSLLAAASVFDVYTGEQVEAGTRSLALRLEFRAPDRTLTDEEVAELRSAIEAELAKLGGRLRA